MAWVYLSRNWKTCPTSMPRASFRRPCPSGLSSPSSHQKPNPMRGIEGGIVSKEMPLDISNVAILNPETNKADRVGIKLVENEGKIKRVRFFKSNGSVIGA